jgi:farnesyl diphosphate synthase
MTHCLAFLPHSSIAGIAYLHSRTSALTDLENAYFALTDDVKFACGLVFVCIVYFASAMYLNAVKVTNASASDCPATCDTVVEVNVPKSIPPYDKDHELFVQLFDQFTKEIVADLEPIYELPKDSVEYIHKMINYTVNGGKMTRGLTAMKVNKIFAESNGRKLSNKERVKSAALGWCIEFLQAFFLVADDIMDSSVTRRGAPCWYKLPDVKMVAINDSFILESCVYKILKRYFGNDEYYPQLVDLFLEVTRQTEIGQLLDLTSQPLDGRIELKRFTMERYRSVAKYKTAFYTFYLPVALGMIVAGVKDRAVYDNARKILLIMGEYFQIQDDFLDCYGKPEDIGKIGTDIEDNKCSWLVVQALNRVNAKQRQILESNYGQHDQKKVEIVKKLYNDLNMRQIFNEYEEQSHKEILELIAGVDAATRKSLEFLLSKTYKRSK